LSGKAGVFQEKPGRLALCYIISKSCSNASACTKLTAYLELSELQTPYQKNMNATLAEWEGLQG
jgi:hypothetical protein